MKINYKIKDNIHNQDRVDNYFKKISWNKQMMGQDVIYQNPTNSGSNFGINIQNNLAYRDWTNHVKMTDSWLNIEKFIKKNLPK